MISGIGVFYPDERPRQRIGIIPDIEGIRAAATKWSKRPCDTSSAPGTPASEIERMAKR